MGRSRGRLDVILLLPKDPLTSTLWWWWMYNGADQHTVVVRS